MPKAQSTMKNWVSFIEIAYTKLSNAIVGCMYKQSSIQINDFMKVFISPLLKIQKQYTKRVFFLLDIFDIDILKHELSDLIIDYSDALSSNFLLPRILLTIRIPKSCILIENISNSTPLEDTSFESFSPISRTSFFKRFFLKVISSKIQYFKTWLEKIWK